MRITVDIEDPLLKRLRAAARRRGASLKAFLSGIIRRALNEEGGGRQRGAARYRFPTFSMGKPAADCNIDTARHMAAALDDVETARELSLRK